jgi:hypothetical protein
MVLLSVQGTLSLDWCMGRVIRSPLSNGLPMNRYKDHPIYGMAVPAPENQWYSRGLVFDRDLNQTIEIKRIESKRRTFKTKKQAEQHGLDLCKAWVDKQP